MTNTYNAQRKHTSNTEQLQHVRHNTHSITVICTINKSYNVAFNAFNTSVKT